MQCLDVYAGLPPYQDYHGRWQVLYRGSANLNARSLRWDYEENAVIVDSCTTQQLVQLFDGKKKRQFLTQ